MRSKMLVAAMATTAALMSSTAPAGAAPLADPGTVCGLVWGQGSIQYSVSVVRGKADCGRSLAAASKLVKGGVMHVDFAANTSTGTVDGLQCALRRTFESGHVKRSWYECEGRGSVIRLDSYNFTHQPKGTKPCWDDICRFV